MTGRVTTLYAAKGYGFIRGDDTGREYFFHASALKNITIDKLAVGHTVTFEDVEADKGPRAEDVYV